MKNAQIRFYAELNEFIPKKNRQKTTRHTFLGKPSVKDVIESLGVPHTEVDLILVNGDSVRFSYSLKDGDEVSVYPVFESMDIKAVSRVREAPLRQSRFVADVHLGKLAKYLRMAGFDTLYENDSSDPELIQIALQQKRILLTRDKGLLKDKRLTHGYLVRATDPKEQIREILERFDLFSKMKPFTICLECNGLIASIEKRKIADKLLPKTRRYYKRFFSCSRCERIFWKGSHFDRMSNFLLNLKPPLSIR